MDKISDPVRPIIIRNRLYSLSQTPRGESSYALIGSQRDSNLSRYSFRQDWAGMISLP